MGLFDHEARQFKFDVLREVAFRAYKGSLHEDVDDEIAHKLIPTMKADFRCCVYKEREIIRQRTRLAMGKNPSQHQNGTFNPNQIVKVIDAACDGCTIKRIQITDSCRKCMAKSCVAACKFDAIAMGTNRAVINYDQCKECGACVKQCPFHAIIETVRPCLASCPVDAISMDDDNIAIIDDARCINCAACQSACPFGAIEDASWIVPVIELIKLNTPITAMIAPSIQGQFDSATLSQIKAGIKMLGFTDVVEVATAADTVVWHEKEELKKKKSNNIKMTTSCCPAFLNLAKQHFPDVYEKNMSTLASPMIVMARYIKSRNPNHGVVFIGPCVAKKQEAMQDYPKADVDYVLTYEEIAAMLVANKIYLPDIEVDSDDQASNYGRYFAFGGGVSNALKHVGATEGFEFSSSYADGCQECKKQLLLMKHNRFTADVLEGMSCVGGCGNGPAIIDNSKKAKQRFDLENKSNSINIHETIEHYDFSNINLERNQKGVAK